MKKIFLVLAALMAVGASHAQTPDREIAVSAKNIERVGDSVHLSLRVDIGRRAVRSGITMLLQPTMVSGQRKWSLPGIAVEGRRARIAEQRREWPLLQNDEITLTQNGRRVDYSAAFPWQGWMDGADLVAENITVGCCSAQDGAPLLWASNIPLPGQPVPAPPVETPQTVGDEIAENNPFVVPNTDFEQGQVFDEDRENSLKVYFHLAKYNIDPALADNAHSLAELTSVIRQLMDANDTELRNIVIAGFASPEGRFAFNDKLALDRASAVKRYLMERTGVSGEAITLHNGSADWRGLRKLVEESDMAQRETILDIIDNVPAESGRMERIRRLDGGTVYQYMLGNMFPQLRNAAYIKIYYENK